MVVGTAAVGTVAAGTAAVGTAAVGTGVAGTAAVGTAAAGTVVAWEQHLALPGRVVPELLAWAVGENVPSVGIHSWDT